MAQSSRRNFLKTSAAGSLAIAGASGSLSFFNFFDYVHLLSDYAKSPQKVYGAIFHK
jgi:hypothetical protein